MPWRSGTHQSPPLQSEAPAIGLREVFRIDIQGPHAVRSPCSRRWETPLASRHQRYTGQSRHRPARVVLVDPCYTSTVCPEPVQRGAHRSECLQDHVGIPCFLLRIALTFGCLMISSTRRWWFLVKSESSDGLSSDDHEVAK